MHRAALDLSELGHPAADVVAIRVVALRLPRRVEHAVGPGVGPGSRDPLPVPDVVGKVAVDEEVGVVRGAETPVDVQVLGQEGRGDEPCPVVHEPLGAELPHARVDERIAGAAVLPGLGAPRRRRATGLREDAGPRSRSRDARRTAGSGSRASRAGARTPHRLLDRLRARRPRGAKGTRSAGTPRAVTSSRRRARLGRSHTRRARSRATRRAERGRRTRRLREDAATSRPS